VEVENTVFMEEQKMSEQTADHAAQLAEAERTNRLRLAWKQVILWGCGGSLLLLIGVFGGFFYYYRLLLPPPAVAMIAALGVIIFFLISAVAGNTLTMIALLRRDSAFLELRFDVYAGVKSYMVHILNQCLPGYIRLHTELDVGEELLKKATHVTKRSADLAAKMQTIYPGLTLVAAIKEMVKASLHSEGHVADNASVQKILDGLEETNVVPIRQAGE
jgi:hypothetical protein